MPRQATDRRETGNFRTPTGTSKRFFGQSPPLRPEAAQRRALWWVPKWMGLQPRMRLWQGPAPCPTHFPRPIFISFFRRRNGAHRHGSRRRVPPLELSPLCQHAKDGSDSTVKRLSNRRFSSDPQVVPPDSYRGGVARRKSSFSEASSVSKHNFGRAVLTLRT
jgi:hypothetical protein